MVPHLEVSGFDKVPGALARITAAVGFGPMSGAAETALEPVLERARELVPVRSGFLRDSLRIAPAEDRQPGSASATGRGGSLVVGPLAADAFYAVFVEFGTVHSPAEPFLTPAVEAEESNVFDLLGRLTGQLILGAVPS